MTIDLAIIQDDIKIGTTISRIGLAKRLNRNIGTLQKKTIRARGETWEASYYNGGRLAGYTLLARLEPMIAAVKSGSAVQQANAAG